MNTTIPAEVAAVLADARMKVKTCRADSTDFALYEVEELCDALEAALTKAEAVAYCDSEDLAKLANVALSHGGHGCTVPLVYAHARPPAVPVESPSNDALDAARFRWLRDHAINTEGAKGSPWCVYGLDLGDCTPTFGAELVAFVDDAMANGIVCSPGPVESLCGDCPPAGYPTEATRCTPCPRRCEPVASVPDGWLPIASAPKDQLICIWITNKPVNERQWGEQPEFWAYCYYDQICGEWRTTRPSGHLRSVPERYVTHWMPIPSEPTNQEGAAPSTLAGFGPMPSVDLSGLTILDGEEEENHHGQ